MKNKKGLIALVAMLGIVIITAGATYAWFSYSKSGTKENTISSGAITFHYQEGAQGLTLDDAMPMSDEYGSTQNRYFEFTIDSKTSDTVEIPYDITVKRSGTGTNMDNVVKVYLTKVNSGVESPVEIVTGKQIATVSELATYLNSTLNIDASKNERKLTTETVPSGTNNYSQVYRLRMWVSTDANFSLVPAHCSDTNITTQEACVSPAEWIEEEYPYNNKTYTLKVNVYGEGAEFSGILPGLYDSSNNLLKSWSELENLGITKDTIERDYSYNNSAIVQAFASNNLSGHLVLPSTIEKIGNYLFYNSNALEGITLSNSVQTIGFRAFYGCKNLSEVIIPEGVTTIGSSAFTNDSNLKTIVIPSTVNSIAYDSFLNTNLSSITVDSNNKTYDSRDNSNAIINTAKNELMVSSTSTVIPNSVLALGDNSFASKNDLTSITIPNNVQKIGNYAFSNCKNLVSINIPNSVTSIGFNAFYGSGLESIVIPDSVTKIEANTFYGCKNLSSVTLPNNLLSIDDVAFYNCSSLESIVIPSNVKWLGDSVFGGSCALKSATFENPSNWYMIEYDYAGSYDEFEENKTWAGIGTNASYNANQLRKYNGYKWVLDGDWDNLM